MLLSICSSCRIHGKERICAASLLSWTLLYQIICSWIRSLWNIALVVLTCTEWIFHRLKRIALLCFLWRRKSCKSTLNCSLLFSLLIFLLFLICFGLLFLLLIHFLFLWLLLLLRLLFDRLCIDIFLLDWRTFLLHLCHLCRLLLLLLSFPQRLLYWTVILICDLLSSSVINFSFSI